MALKTPGSLISEELDSSNIKAMFRRSLCQEKWLGSSHALGVEMHEQQPCVCSVRAPGCSYVFANDLSMPIHTHMNA